MCTLLLSAGWLLCTFSCQTDSIPEAVELQKDSDLSNSKTSIFNARSLNLSEEEVYLYPEDQNYEMIDMGRYALGKALKDLLTVEMMSKIINHAKQTESKAISFEKMFSLFPYLKNELDDLLAAQSLPGCPYDFSSYNQIQNVMNRNGIDYDLELYVLNLDTTPGGKSFILTPGTQIEDEDNYEDQITAWYLKDNTSNRNNDISNLSSIKITEHEAVAYSTLGTLLSIALKAKDVVLAPVNGGGGPTTPIGGPVLNTISIRDIKIQHRYEKHGKSEIYMQAVKNTGSAWNGVFGANFFGRDYSKHLTSTKKINEWVQVDKGQTLFLSNINVVWNIFERDWWEGLQEVNNVYTNGTTVERKLKAAPMTFYGEWYSITPENNNLSNGKSMGTLKSQILLNGTNNTWVPGDQSKSEVNFYAQ